jgi:hypothetical protein
VVGAVAAYAYDSSREETIAKGVSIGGVDVGALSADEARATVREQVAAKVERPIVVRHDDVRFTLSAADAGLRADVGGMVGEALEVSREPSIFERVARDLTGGEENVDVAVRVSYSQTAVAKLVKRVSGKLNRPAKDASLDFPSLEAVEEQDGLKVKAGRLLARVEGALRSSSEDRTIKAPVRRTKPEVTRAELASKYPVVLVADRSTFQLRLYKDLELAEDYSVAFGAVGYDTPAGLYNIQNKAIDPAWHVPNSDWAGDLAGTVVPGGTPENPLKARWLGIYNGAGIHGTSDTGSLGSAASHGCIRMAIPDVIDLYDRVPVGAPIYIS